MRLTTNYTRSDWNRFAISACIHLIPFAIFLYGAFAIALPHINVWSDWLEYQTENEMIVEFRDLYYPDFNTDEIMAFYAWTWFGGGVAPIVVFWFLHRLFPANYICKRLNIQPRMKLVIFKDGRPIKLRRKK